MNNLDIKFTQISNVLPGCSMPEDFVINNLSIDSRTIVDGDTYLAIKGKNFDGHDFISDAIEKGASSIVKSSNVETKVPSLLVNDTLKALGVIANIHRNRLSGKVIGVTGSNGKTTVKNMALSIGLQCGNAMATISNNNNKIGVPLTLLSAKNNHDYVIIEIGTSEKGEISWLGEIVEPDISVITNVSESHLEGIGTCDDVFREKSAIINATRHGGTVAVNMDDAYASRYLQVTGCCRSVIRYGLKNIADIEAEYQMDATGSYVKLRYKENIINYKLSLPGQHYILNSLAAAALMSAAGADMASIGKGLELFQGEPGRLSVESLAQKISLIDDSYNANPASTMAALEVISIYPGRKIFVYGGMVELGDISVDKHSHIGVYASDKNIDILFCFGHVAKPVVESFRGDAYWFDKITDLNQKLVSTLKKGDIVLVKGSRSFKMERVSDFLRKNFH